MLQTFNLPLLAEFVAEYGGWPQLQREAAALGCAGIEAIWAGEDIPADLPEGLVQGYHLTFFPDWLDMFRNRQTTVKNKFGSMAIAFEHYGGWGPDCLLRRYQEDLARAERLRPRYLVFHVSDVSLAEGLTYQWQHCNAEVIDAALELINALLADYAADAPWEFLVENQWWPGFTFTEPAETARLLEGINYPRKGIMLDVGHLMNCNRDLQTQAQGAAYVQAMLDKHGSLAQAVRGVHLHYSLSGAYVKEHIGELPEWWASADYAERTGYCYNYVLRIDQHLPWTDKTILPTLARINPAYLTHEFNAGSRQERRQMVAQQKGLLKRGGLL